MLSFIKQNVENDNILVFSSILFLIPAYIAYQNEMYLHSILTLFLAILSCYNWLQYRKTNKSTTLDIYCSHLTLITYVVSCCINAKSYLIKFFGLVNGLNISIFYFTAWQTVEDKFTTNMLHFLMHICALIGKFLVVLKL